MGEMDQVSEMIHAMRKDFNAWLRDLDEKFSERFSALESKADENKADIENLYSIVARLAASPEAIKRGEKVVISPQRLYEELDREEIPRRAALRRLAEDGKLRRSCGKNTMTVRIDGDIKRMVVINL